MSQPARVVDLPFHHQIVYLPSQTNAPSPNSFFAQSPSPTEVPSATTSSPKSVPSPSPADLLPQAEARFDFVFRKYVQRTTDGNGNDVVKVFEYMILGYGMNNWIFYEGDAVFSLFSANPTTYMFLDGTKDHPPNLLQNIPFPEQTWFFIPTGKRFLTCDTILVAKSRCKIFLMDKRTRVCWQSVSYFRLLH